jgi:hypothetical protein
MTGLSSGLAGRGSSDIRSFGWQFMRWVDLRHKFIYNTDAKARHCLFDLE